MPVRRHSRIINPQADCIIYNCCSAEAFALDNGHQRVYGGLCSTLFIKLWDHFPEIVIHFLGSNITSFFQQNDIISSGCRIIGHYCTSGAGTDHTNLGFQGIFRRCFNWQFSIVKYFKVFGLIFFTLFNRNEIDFFINPGITIVAEEKQKLYFRERSQDSAPFGSFQLS